MSTPTDLVQHQRHLEAFNLLDHLKNQAEYLLSRIDGVLFPVRPEDGPLAVLNLGLAIVDVSDFLERTTTFWVATAPVKIQGYSHCVNTSELIARIAWRIWWATQVASREEAFLPLNPKELLDGRDQGQEASKKEILQTALDPTRFPRANGILTLLRRRWQLVELFLRRLSVFDPDEWRVRLHQEYVNVRSQAAASLLSPRMPSPSLPLFNPRQWELIQAIELSGPGWAVLTHEERIKSLEVKPHNNERQPPKRKRKSPVAELVLSLLDDLTFANMNQRELAKVIKRSFSAVCRAFQHPKYGPMIQRKYEQFGIQPPTIHHV